MARIYDNIDVQFTDGLHEIVGNVGVKRVDFCVGYFNLRGWDLIMGPIDNLPGDEVYETSSNGSESKVTRYCRLLIGMHRPDEDLVRALYSPKKTLTDSDYVISCKRQIAQNFKQQLLLGIPTAKDEHTLQHLSQQLKDGKVCVKLYVKEPLHAKLYLAHQPGNYNKHIAIMGSSNLTYSGMTGQGELNADFADSDHVDKLTSWFDERWNDRFCIDITKELIEIIDESWAGDKIIPPYYIYLKAAYHLSQEARSGIKEFTLAPEFQHDLFDFQQNAVKIAAKNLNNDKRNGAMIGDVVGLGKTITACAIARLYQDTFGGTTLIICPANLQDMWQKYRAKYDINCDIISMAKPIDVEQARYYRLIIVDESHNLRNSNGKRYQNIRALIEKQDSKVLLLTATPYNKDFSDLGNQLSLFIDEDQDLGIRPENYIAAIGGDYQFAYKHSDVDIRSIKAFTKSDNADDWAELMKLFLVRRTRSFIKNNYAKTDPENNRKYLQFPDGRKSYFPDRLPKSIKFKTEPWDQYSRLYSPDMLLLMAELKLPRYGLSQYYDKKHDGELSRVEQQLIDNLSKAGQRMMGFCKSTFFKRIDSSGFSFLLTLYRHILRNALFIYAIDNKLSLPIGDENNLPDEYVEDEDSNNVIFYDENDKVVIEGETISIPTEMEVYLRKAREYYGILQDKNNCSWIDSKYFKSSLKRQLKKDCEVLIRMINLCGAWNPTTDQKLNELQSLITGQHKDDKVIIFTQYSDTADYVYRQLKRRGFKNIDVATGGSQNPTAIVERFSPHSNDRPDMPLDQQTRVLIATDVLSEGQNLQDSHVIVNFDLPWAIIRLIQRAGRVDRIGQESEKIYCYSFFPADGVEEIIKLRSRLNDRINENAQIVGSDEVFFEGNEQNLRDMFNEKNGVLDDDDDNDVDLSSQAYQIWKNAIDANPKLKNIIPNLSNVIYSTKATDNALEEGVITYARTFTDFDVLSWVGKDGNVISQSQKRILQAMACSIDTPMEQPLDNHHELVSQAITSIEEENKSMGGNLGTRFSTRYRIHHLLDSYYNDTSNVGLFFTEEQRQELKLAIDEIFRFPFQAQTKYTLGSMLSKKRTDYDIVDYVLELRRTGNLCKVDTEDNGVNKQPSIICSMGIKKK
jgi:superfamily II DNA or RNA helicase